jgi:hypothetical protein
VNATKNGEAAKSPQAAYVLPTLRKQQLIEEVLGDGLLTTRGVVD